MNNSAKPCESYRQKLLDFHLQELRPGDALSITAHLSNCHDCQALSSEFKRAAEFLRQDHVDENTSRFVSETLTAAKRLEQLSIRSRDDILSTNQNLKLRNRLGNYFVLEEAACVLPLSNYHVFIVAIEDYEIVRAGILLNREDKDFQVHPRHMLLAAGVNSNRQATAGTIFWSDSANSEFKFWENNRGDFEFYWEFINQEKTKREFLIVFGNKY